MSQNVWTVKPEHVTIELSYAKPDGTVYPFWIEVKKYLNVGEARRVTTAGWRSMSSGKQEEGATEPGPTEIHIDWKAQTFSRTEAYLVDWSLAKDGVPMTRGGIESLDPDVYKLIEDAITAHTEAMEAAKKQRVGSSLPSTMSA